MMANEPFNPLDTTRGKQNNWPEDEEGKLIGTGEGEVPQRELSEAPGVSNLDMRTSASDVASIKESGGGAPRSYTPPPAPSYKASGRLSEEQKPFGGTSVYPPTPPKFSPPQAFSQALFRTDNRRRLLPPRNRKFRN